MSGFIITMIFCFLSGIVGYFGGRVLLRENLGRWADSQRAQVNHTWLTSHSEFIQGYNAAMRELKMEIRIYD